MPERELTGLPASPGIALGWARLLDPPDTGNPSSPPVPADRRVEEAALAESALQLAASEIGRLAARCGAGPRGRGRDRGDRNLDGARPRTARGRASGRARACRPRAALLEAAGEHADAIAALGDATLAERADDVRSVGRRAARIAAGGEESAGPAARSFWSHATRARRRGRDRPGGGASPSRRVATAHAAIVARSLGLPMVVAAGEELLASAPARSWWWTARGTRGDGAGAPSAVRAAR